LFSFYFKAELGMALPFLFSFYFKAELPS